MISIESHTTQLQYCVQRARFVLTSVYTRRTRLPRTYTIRSCVHHKMFLSALRQNLELRRLTGFWRLLSCSEPSTLVDGFAVPRYCLFFFKIFSNENNVVWYLINLETPPTSTETKGPNLKYTSCHPMWCYTEEFY